MRLPTTFSGITVILITAAQMIWGIFAAPPLAACLPARLQVQKTAKSKIGVPSPAAMPQPVGSQQVKLRGTIIDLHCATIAMQAGEARYFGRNHQRACVLLPVCLSSGLGLLTASGHWYPFTTSSSHSLALALRKLHESFGLDAVIEADWRGGKLVLQSIRWLAQPRHAASSGQ